MPVSKEVQKYNLRIRIEYFKSASIFIFQGEIERNQILKLEFFNW